MLIAQVETVGEGVELQGGPGIARLVHHCAQVHLVGWALPDQPPGGMGDHLHVGVADGGDDAPGDLLAVLPEAAVHGGDDHVQEGEHLIVVVQAAVVVDVELRPREEGDGRVPGAVELPDRLHLPLEFVAIEASRYPQVGGVVG